MTHNVCAYCLGAGTKIEIKSQPNSDMQYAFCYVYVLSCDLSYETTLSSDAGVKFMCGRPGEGWCSANVQSDGQNAYEC